MKDKEKEVKVEDKEVETVTKAEYDALYAEAVALNNKYNNTLALLNNLINYTIEGRK